MAGRPRSLCVLLPDIELLVLNTYGTGVRVGELCLNVRTGKRGLPILHIGSKTPVGMPADVPGGMIVEPLPTLQCQGSPQDNRS
jgi:hypothetical protein